MTEMIEGVDRLQGIIMTMKEGIDLDISRTVIPDPTTDLSGLEIGITTTEILIEEWMVDLEIETMGIEDQIIGIMIEDLLAAERNAMIFKVFNLTLTF